MKKITFFILIAFLIGISTNVNSQGVAINTDGSAPDGSAMLDVASDIKGLLIPRMTTSKRNSISSPAKGLMVYDLTLDQVYMNTGTSGNPTWTNISTGQLWTRVGSYTYLTNSSDDVGIGTSAPARALEVRGHWRTARLSSKSYAGAFLEFVGTHATDWAMGTWDGTARISSSTDEFASSSTEYLFSTDRFSPFANNDKYLGSTSIRWKNIYSIDGDFSGDVGIGTNSPARTLEVRGDWRTARLSSTSYLGAFLEFVGTHATDWAMGTWDGTARISSSTDEFANSSTEFLFSTTYFSPFSDNTKYLGSTSIRWKNIYSIDGNFSDDIYLYDNVKFSTLSGMLHIYDYNNSNAIVYITPQTSVDGDSATLFLAEDHDASYGMYWLYDGDGNEMELWGKSGNNYYGPHILVTRNSGNVAIGNDFASGYKLSVDGKIACEEVLVKASGSWPDYVFCDNYNLVSLQELEQKIDLEKHLPGLPSAKEIEENGVLLGDMQKMLLEKIEELTLHLIQQNKKIEALEKEIEKMKKP